MVPYLFVPFSFKVLGPQQGPESLRGLWKEGHGEQESQGDRPRQGGARGLCGRGSPAAGVGTDRFRLRRNHAGTEQQFRVWVQLVWGPMGPFTAQEGPHPHAGAPHTAIGPRGEGRAPASLPAKTRGLAARDSPCHASQLRAESPRHAALARTTSGAPSSCLKWGPLPTHAVHVLACKNASPWARLAACNAEVDSSRASSFHSSQPREAQGGAASVLAVPCDALAWASVFPCSLACRPDAPFLAFLLGSLCANAGSRGAGPASEQEPLLFPPGAGLVGTRGSRRGWQRPPFALGSGREPAWPGPSALRCSPCVWFRTEPAPSPTPCWHWGDTF